MDHYTLTPLYDRQDLNNKCIQLLNQEWPRSDGSREHSQQKSCRTSPPMSFLFIEKNTDRLVGHARICLLPNRPSSCWIESVIVDKECRGIGLGRLLMTLLEEAAKKFGFDEAYLCTDDQVCFYERCGYKVCDPILHSTTATSVFPVPKLTDPQPNKEAYGGIVSSSSTASSSNSPSTPSAPGSSARAPPPPPPPPRVLLSRTTTTPAVTANHRYMWKKLT